MNKPWFLGHLLIFAEWRRKKVQRRNGRLGTWCSLHPALTYRRSPAILFDNSPPGTCAVSQLPSQPVTELLVRWRAGDQDALEQLIPVVYKELRQIAHYHLQRERPGHTLQSAALVHEAYLRLLDQKPFEADNRAHFLA